MPEGLEERLRAKQTAAAKEVAGSLGSRTASNRSEGSSKIVGADAEMNLDLGNLESNCPSVESEKSESETSQTHLGANPGDEPVPRTQDLGSVQVVNAKVLHDFKSTHAGAEERTIG